MKELINYTVQDIFLYEFIHYITYGQEWQKKG